MGCPRPSARPRGSLPRRAGHCLWYVSHRTSAFSELDHQLIGHPGPNVGPLPTSRRSSGRQLVVDGRLIVVELAQELASWATAAGAVIAAIGLLLTARQLKIQNRQHRLELGGLYINRFWSVDDELTMADPASEPERYKRLRIPYLKLCEDEFDAARLGWLDPQQWAVWHSE